MPSGASPRKLLEPIHVRDLRALNRGLCLATSGTICHVSASGLLIRVQQQDLSPVFLRRQLSFEALTRSSSRDSATTC